MKGNIPKMQAKDKKGESKGYSVAQYHQRMVKSHMFRLNWKSYNVMCPLEMELGCFNVLICCPKGADRTCSNFRLKVSKSNVCNTQDSETCEVRDCHCP